MILITSQNFLYFIYSPFLDEHVEDLCKQIHLWYFDDHAVY